MTRRNILNYPLFALGFRPFFMLAGLSGLALMLIWNLMLHGAVSSGHYFSGNYWHAHEMLLGYSVAVIAGFLLTAVKNWTGSPTWTGDQLAGMCLLWIYGRITPFYAVLLPDGLIAITDMAFLPLLAYCITKPILASKQYHNLIFTGLLLLFTVGNGLIHSEMLGMQANVAGLGLQLIVDSIVVLILVMAGRVFPFFTERGLPGTLTIRTPQLDVGSIVTAVVFFGLQLFGVTGWLLAVAALLAVMVNGARVAGWYTPKIWYVPLLWVLYVGYGWLILGFGLAALSAYSIITPSLALHAFTLGGIGTLTFGMMVRVSLGHTGRKLQASNTIAFAFLLLNAAAFFRVILPSVLPQWQGFFSTIAVFTWLGAFAFFMVEYGPILCANRIDGNDG
jgi:uncharacterized protein involved in response to NO